jgi:hypothetical protein
MKECQCGYLCIPLPSVDSGEVTPPGKHETIQLNILMALFRPYLSAMKPANMTPKTAPNSIIAVCEDRAMISKLKTSDMENVTNMHFGEREREKKKRGGI